MKNLKNLAIFILAAAVLSSCGGLNKMVKDSGYCWLPGDSHCTGNAWW